MRHFGLIAGVALLVLAVVAAVFWFSRTTTLPDSKPTLEASPSGLQLKSQSGARMPVRVPFATIQTIVNEDMPRKFVGDLEDPVKRPQITEDRLEWTVTRGDVAVAAEGPSTSRRLRVASPLTGTARLRARVDLGRKSEGDDGGRAGKLLGLLKLPKFKVDVTGDLGGQLTVYSAPRLHPDYRIEPRLAADVRITKAELPIKRLGRVDVRRPVQIAIDKSKDRFVKAAEKKIAESDLFRKALAQRWERLFIVRQVKKEPVTWFVFRPTGLEASQPIVEADALVFGIGIKAETHVVIAANPPANPPTPLPAKLSIIDRLEDGAFTMEIPVSLPWSEVKRLANDPKFARKAKLKIDAMSKQQDLTLGEILLQPSGNSVVLSVDFTEKTGGLLGKRHKGTLHIVARPTMRSGKPVLTFTGIRYHVQTKNLLTSVASALVAPATMQALASGVAIDLTSTLEKATAKAREQIAASLANLPAGIDLSVDLDRLKVQRIVVTRDHLNIVIGATGKIGALTLTPDLR